MAYLLVVVVVVVAHRCLHDPEYSAIIIIISSSSSSMCQRDSAVSCRRLDGEGVDDLHEVPVKSSE